MKDIAFIGDEITASGFRLAGVRTYSPAPELTRGLFFGLVSDCRCIILSAEAQRQLPPQMLQACVERGHPLLLTVPDAAYRTIPADIRRDIRKRLGMSE